MVHVSMYRLLFCSCGAQGFALALLRRHYSARLRLDAARYRLGLRIALVVLRALPLRSYVAMVRPTLTRTCSSQLRVSFAHLCTRLHSLSAAALSSFDLCF